MVSAGAPSATPYAAPWWLPGGNLQTIYASLLASAGDLRFRRERWTTPDGDFVDVDDVAGDAGAPLVVLFHGLEGSSRSHYALALMRALAHRGWRGAVAHFRGCSGEPNRLPRAYHSGDSAEIDWMLRRFRSQAGGAPLLAVGVSLGGNALLKWLGEQGGEACAVVAAAASVSAPLDLMAAGDALGRGFNLLYTRAFLATLRRKSTAKLAQYPGLYDREAVLRARTLRAFDNVVTAPLHGFRNTDDYWRRSSSKPWLSRVRVRTLLVNARNDPFLPDHALPSSSEVSAEVQCEFPDEGGHAGFVTGAFPGHIDWPARRIISFFEHQL
jgi:predicted alpha/beta-fold hydrolase